MNLCELKKGQKCIIYEPQAPENINRRLMDIGLVDNTVVECVEISPFGDPKAFLIRGAVIALRKDESQNITVKELIV
ncbi:MAG: ferrous iron transport protein A [Ruminococcaceae bacterium]|nr:ferrous iron transport protein A [Oscillospiraceae bacterium]